MGDPKKDATDHVTVSVQMPDGTTASFGVDIPVGASDTPAQKAAKIADGVNNDPDNDVDGNPTTPGKRVKATSTGHVVSAVGQDGSQLKGLSYTDATKQGEVTFEKQPRTPSSIGE